ncbi:hypothetical protein BKA67DRAFT_509648 [Truncatella angustata]|uniref:PAS domain-containing protein n=1 Tax=Truncatella angustata TaxID=152316 RepID=A0A9P9A4W7_9PEZI|nr:uncharacterized protein BKA67DRAFT_509648 [Truncatella angustata]KAH6660695.1 hypothetical protein BKA67DRAFT_509648 [Truncatella angustata]
MEHTFITIHNLSPEANILFASASITEILGYEPHEVQGRPCFDYFHPDEEAWARKIHGRGVRLDKAASLHYLRVQHRNGQWISCECCFTIVHDVLVACTSIYRIGAKSERRAIEAPQIRRIFSSSPRDPRYHMLEHLSPKFRMPPVEREPRAALILNRFTRPLSIMFSTDAVSQILGLRPDQIQHKSFYECIANNCLADAVRCLESAKSNDSIAYLRFWFRDPRTQEELDAEIDGGVDGIDGVRGGHGMDGANGVDGVDGVRGRGSPSSSDMDSDGGAHLSSPMDLDDDGDAVIKTESMSPDPSKAEVLGSIRREEASTNHAAGSSNAAPDAREPAQGRTNVADQDDIQGGNQDGNRRQQGPLPAVELEAVVSCTSDGLVVILRRARPAIPNMYSPSISIHSQNGLFAAPWGEQPIQPYYPPELYHRFQSPLLPQHMPLQEHAKAAGGPPTDMLMRSIRDVAVFAWALCGINGNFAAYGRGIPRGEAQPPNGLPIWDPSGGQTSYLGPENQARYRWQQSGLNDHKGKGLASSNHRYMPGPSGGGLNSYGSAYGGSNYTSQHYSRPSWGQSTGYSHMGHEHMYHQSHHAPQMAASYHQGYPVQEPWAEAAAANLAQQQQQEQGQNGDQSVAGVQASNPVQEPRNIRRMWQ